MFVVIITHAADDAMGEPVPAICYSMDGRHPFLGTEAQANELWELLTHYNPGSVYEVKQLVSPLPEQKEEGKGRIINDAKDMCTNCSSPWVCRLGRKCHGIELAVANENTDIPF